MKRQKFFACDFETTVYENQQDTEVWASACVELYTEDVKIFGSINKIFDYFKSLKCNVVAYFHNLKFDGAFWIDFLLCQLKLEQAYYLSNSNDFNTLRWIDDKEMKPNTFKYTISDKGQWYNIKIKCGKHIIEIRDSLKLLPFSIKQLGVSFDTKHKKMEMEYKGLRFANCRITDQELEYIKNDVLVLKEVLEFMFENGHNKLTIGACCLSEFKNFYGKEDWNLYFPNPKKSILYGNMDCDSFVRKSYKGGWCYVKRGCENQVVINGLTVDVNSLYPSVMHSKSKNRYPIGLPHYWKGNFIDDKAKQSDKYYFVHIKCRFHLKDGYLPFIQIKDKYIYNPHDVLETSDYYCSKTKKYYRYYRDKYTNEVIDSKVELTLTCTDYKLFLEHYNVEDLEIIDGIWFYSEIGLFDGYIDKYAEIKKIHTGARRNLAKLFLNNLYGKFASSSDNSFKVAYIKENGVVGFNSVVCDEKETVYIPIGSAITSYARDFTIRHAQANYEHFKYADTDSLHLNCKPSDIKEIELDDVEFLCWKLEAVWDKAIFVRQKTYIEHVTQESKNGELVTPKKGEYYNIKCAGMPDTCKDLLTMSLTNTHKEYSKCSMQEKEFLFNDKKEPIQRNLTDFKIGFKVCGKLRPTRIMGGIVLEDSMYEMR